MADAPRALAGGRVRCRASAPAQRLESTGFVKQIGCGMTTDLPETSAPPAHPVWRLLLSPPASGAENMALDEALMCRARATREWTLRVYFWSSPTLSFGRNQVARGGYRPDELRRHAIDCVRRPTGGRAILHHREITYSVTGPQDGAGDLRESYGRINRLLVDGLRALGVAATVVPRTAQPVPDARPDRALDRPGLLPCFDHPSIGEITVAGRKLAGSAQWRGDGAFLQHGSILVDDDQMQIASLLTAPAPAVPAPATLRQALGRAPAPSEVAAALFDAVRRLEDASAAPLEPDATLAEHARVLRERYLDDRWTWRR
jgi:lipoate-protein ligase A